MLVKHARWGGAADSYNKRADMCSLTYSVFKNIEAPEPMLHSVDIIPLDWHNLLCLVSKHLSKPNIFFTSNGKLRFRIAHRWEPCLCQS